MADDDEIPTLVEHTEIQTEVPPSGVGKERVPCTLITGFLGAGKSTLLKRILTDRHGYRIAVIMNEFGDTADIEAKAINVSTEEGSSEEFLELANGCLCCSIKDTGIAAIEKLMQKKGAFDYILLETTGLADPGPIAAMFWQNEEYTAGLGQYIFLDGVVCVVDAVFGEKQMTEDKSSEGFGVSLRQIACSDVVLLNKTDIPPEQHITQLEKEIQKCNPSAPIYRTVRGEIELQHVIGLNAYAAKLNIDSTGFSFHESHGHEHNHEHGDHNHAQSGATTHESISSLQVTCPILSPARAEELDKWIRAALWDGHLPDDHQHQVEILRCKGLYVMADGTPYVLQGVRNLYEITEVEGEIDTGVPDNGKLVFIGKGLNERARESLLSILR